MVCAGAGVGVAGRVGRAAGPGRAADVVHAARARARAQRGPRAAVRGAARRAARRHAGAGRRLRALERINN